MWRYALLTREVPGDALCCENQSQSHADFEDCLPALIAAAKAGDTASLSRSAGVVSTGLPHKRGRPGTMAYSLPKIRLLGSIPMPRLRNSLATRANSAGEIGRVASSIITVLNPSSAASRAVYATQ